VQAVSVSKMKYTTAIHTLQQQTFKPKKQLPENLHSLIPKAESISKEATKKSIRQHQSK